jgi:hypothetical protein
MQNVRHDAERFAKQLTLRNRTFRNYAQDVHSLNVTYVESKNPFPGTLAPKAPDSKYLSDGYQNLVFIPDGMNTRFWKSLSSRFICRWLGWRTVGRTWLELSSSSRRSPRLRGIGLSRQISGRIRKFHPNENNKTHYQEDDHRDDRFGNF